MPRLSSRFLLLFLVTAVLGGGLVGCDSGGGGDDLEASSATVQFASAGKSATPSDSLVSVPITLQNPQGSEVSVEVLFAAQASSAPDSAIGGGETKSVTFPSSAESGATQSVTFDVSKADLSGGPLDAYFALQNAQSEAPVEIGETDEFAINIGATPIAEARQKPTGTTVTIEGTITRSDDIGFYFQDGSGAALYVVHFGEGPLGSAVTSGDLGVGTQLRLTGSTGEYEGLYQLQDVGGSYTVLAQEAELPAPQEIALADVGEEYEAELVSVAGLTIDASGSFQAGTGYTLGNASGESITMFVPDGSGLVGQTIPDGETTYTGVVDVFSGSFQFLGLRAGDIGEADDGGGNGPNVVSIAEAREMSGTEVTVEGLVTRVADAGAYLQDETAGVKISRQGSDFTGAVTKGDSLRATGTVTFFNGLAQFDQDDLASYEVLSSGHPLPESPPTLTLSEIADGGEEHEAEVVRVEGFTFANSDGSFASDGGDGFGNYTITDGSGGGGEEGVPFRVPEGSYYIDQPIPDGEVIFQGVLGQFSGSDDPSVDQGYQLTGLDEGDLEETDGGGGDAQVILAEDFQDGADLGAFSQYSVSSDSNWVRRSFEGNGYAYINQYDADEAANDWLITDEVLALDDFQNEVLTFTNVKRYGSGDTDLRLKYSTDYDGEGDPTSATWTDISGRVTWDDASGDYTFQTAGPVDLSDLPGSVYLAFHYTEADDALWQLDDILIEEEGASDGGFSDPPGRP